MQPNLQDQSMRTEFLFTTIEIYLNIRSAIILYFIIKKNCNHHNNSRLTNALQICILNKYIIVWILTTTSKSKENL